MKQDLRAPLPFRPMAIPAKRARRLSSGVAVVACALAACNSAGRDGMEEASSGPATAEAQRPHSWSFDGLEPTTAPEGWRAESTNPNGPVALWEVTSDTRAPSPPYVFALTNPRRGEGQTFNLFWTDDVRMRDGRIDVRVRTLSGVEDQGGGVAWRIQDADNYYIARWNPLEDNFRVYYVKDGERHQIGSARVRTDPDAWHAMTIEMRGEHILCSFDGESLLDVRDRTFSEAGGIGLWTKADAATAFDDLEVVPEG